MLRLKTLISLLPLLASASLAKAEDLPAPDLAKQIIERQLAAFAKDDAVEAYSYAAPRIKQVFPDPRIFMAIVAAQYPAVYRHRSVEFGPSKEQEGGLAQAVTFIDGDGQVWTALYSLEKEGDGHWSITGCVIAKSAEKSL